MSHSPVWRMGGEVGVVSGDGAEDGVVRGAGVEDGVVSGEGDRMV